MTVCVCAFQCVHREDEEGGVGGGRAGWLRGGWSELEGRRSVCVWGGGGR